MRPQPTPAASKLLRRVRALAHVDDPDRARAYVQMLGGSGRSGLEERFGVMLFYSLWPDGGGFPSASEGLAALRGQDAVRDQLRQVVDIAFDATTRLTVALPRPLARVPLRVHGSYSREEILAGLGHATRQRPPSQFREGLLFTEVDGHPIAVPLGIAVDHVGCVEDRPALPHGRQHTAAVRAPAQGRRVRHRAYVFLGDAAYVSHTGDRPIAITWRLRTPMPAGMFAATSLAQCARSHLSSFSTVEVLPRAIRLNDPAAR